MSLLVNVGFPSTGFGVYQSYMVQLPSMSHALASSVVSVRALVSLAATLLVAHYYRRLDCRAGVALGTALTGAGFIVYSLASSFPMFVAGAVLAGLGYGLGGVVGSTLLVGRWFKTDVGKAMGFATVGSGAAGALVPVIAERVISTSSLHISFLAQGVFAVIMAVVIFMLLRNQPADMGLKPHGAGLDGSSVKVPMQSGVQVSKLAHAMLVLAMICIGSGCVGGVAYVAILMTSNGISEVMAAATLSTVGIALCVGKFFMGTFMDALGNRRASLMFFGVFLVGLALLCLTPVIGEPWCIAAAVLYGLGASIGSTGISVWSIEFSNQSSRARVARDFQSSYSLGGLLFNLLPGVLMELVGSYVVTYVVLFVLILAAAVIIAGVYRTVSRAAA